jgi:hypothetical protein
VGHFLTFKLIDQLLNFGMVPRGGIEPPTLRFSGSFFMHKISKIENLSCLIGQQRSMSYLGFV